MWEAVITSLVNNLGGTAGFGEFSLARNDDSSTPFIDLRPIFGAQGINFFGHYYTGFYLNNNGSVTFNTATSSFTPSAITGSTSNPVIAAYWADIDTRGGTVTPTAGGTSTGSNLLWYDLDPITHTFTATWDDVGYYSSQTNKLNAFQLSIQEVNDQGDFDIAFRYENVDWTTGGASGGSNGLGGTPARAGYSSGNGVEYFELPQSGNQAALLALESASNVGTPGTFVFSVRNGVPTVGVTVGDASLDEGDGPDPGYIVVPVFLTEPSASTVTVHYSTANGTALAGQDYVAQSGTLTFAPGVTQQNILVAVTGDAIVEGNESFTVTLSDPSEGASILDGSATGTIVDDDAALSITEAGADAVEGDAGTTAFTFTVTRTGDTTRPATASWAVSGPAVNGADFAGGTLPSGTVTLGIGETSKTIALHVAGDTQLEGDESFTVILSDPGPGTSLGTASATGVIHNDDFAPASLSIAATSADKAESQSDSTGFIFTVTRTGDLSSAASAQWTVGGEQVDGADFAGGELPSGVVSFAAGESSKVITVDVAGDTAVESDEAFTVTLSDPSAGAVIGTASAEGVIRNDDASLSIAATSADKAEGQSETTAFTFTVTRTGDLSSTASASWAVTGPAVNGADFAGGVLPSGQVNFAAGESSQIITIDVDGDTTVESNEAFSVTLSDPSAGAILVTASANGVIRNDDASLSIAATSADKAEGQSGITAFTFTVTRAGDLSGAASAQWAVSGAGVDGADFTGGVLPTGQVSFAAGESSKVITIDVAGGTAVESDEAFSVTLSNPSAGAVIGTASASGVIRNDDASLSITATGADEAEGQSGTTAFSFTVSRTGDLSSAAGANWAVTGPAVNGADFAGGVLPTGQVSFAAGESSKVITIDVAGDTLVESNEAFTVTLSNPSAGAVLSTASATGIIRNDDASLSIAATSADKAEGQSGAAAFTFTVTRTGDLSSATSAQWAVGDAGVDGADFTDGELPTGVVSFAAGESSKVITVDVAGDTAVESNESFSVTLSNPSAGAIVGTASANGVIRNDDASLSIAATSADKAEGQSGTTAFTFAVTRTGDLSGAASASWAVTGPAVSGADFPGDEMPSGVVSFAAGESSKVVTVDVAGDTTVESNEAFTVTLSDPSVGAVIETASASGVIGNDDASLSIAATDTDKAEGQSGVAAFTFTVTRAGDLSGAASAQWVVGGAGVDGADFTDGELPSGVVSFAAGENSKVITVDVAGDTAVESDEAFTVTLSDPGAGAVIGTASASGVIRNDDTSLSIAATSADKAEGDLGATAFTFTVTRAGDLSGTASASWAVTDEGTIDSDFIPTADLLESADLLSDIASSVDLFFPGVSLFGGLLPSGTVSFAAGESSKTVTVWTLGETVLEGDESFTVTLSDASEGSFIDTSSAVGTIRNDDGPPAGLVSISDVTVTEGDDETQLATFTVTRTGGTAAFGVDYATADGTAMVTDGDYAATFGTLHFGDGVDVQTFSVLVNGDSVFESDEIFFVDLSGATHGAVLGIGTGVGTILNDDIAPGPTTLVGTPGDDNLNGGPGDDIIIGLAGSDILGGGAGNDSLDGGPGTDLLIGGLGADTLSGGDGDDYLLIDSEDTVIDGGAGFDSAFVLTSDPVTLDMGAASIEWALGDVGADTFNAATQTGGVYIYGMEGDDTLTGSAFCDYLDGGDGADTLTGGDGDDLLVGNGGSDILRGQGGDDYLIELGGDSQIDGGAGFDSLFVWSDTGVTLDLATASIEWVQGSVLGGDTLNAAANTVNTYLYGWGGADVLTGGSANDYIAGGVGNDTLTGGAGNDTLIGETGTDRYVYTAATWGSDTIHSFDSNSETLDFTAVASIHSFADFTAFEWDPGNLGYNSTTLFHTDGGTTSSITLIGVQVASLSDGDFLFA